MPVMRESITDKIKLGLLHAAGKTISGVANTSDMLRSSSHVLKGGIETVGGSLVSVKDNLMRSVHNMACANNATLQDNEINLSAHVDD